jgi:hypothetical protein
MKRFVCWGERAVGETIFIDIGALPTSYDSLFLAAHTPVRVAHLVGPEVSSSAAGEVQILEALLSDVGSHSESNSLIAVTGAPGTGKSHVVRWLNAQLRNRAFEHHVLYVPREISNLKELLKTLINGLPGDTGSEMLDRVEEAIGTFTEPEVASRLLSAMEQQFRWSFPQSGLRTEETPEDREQREQQDLLLGQLDDDGRRRGGMADMLGVPEFRDHLERETGTLRAVAASLVGTVEGRDAGAPKFQVEDVSLRAGQNRSFRHFLSTVTARPEPALALLQEALERALPEFVGLSNKSGETLESLFSDAREQLRSQGQDLVLLFEDLALFGLIDGTLFNQFLIHPGSRYAPLRVVFAITTAKWDERVPAAVQRRVRHRYDVLPIQETVAGNEIAPIKEFLARYLNLVRLGRADVQAAWDSAETEARETGRWIPNACATLRYGQPCEFIGKCHAGFGSADAEPIGRVGIYPFNESALRRLALKLGPHASNPSYLMAAALEGVLVEARPSILSGAYPDRRVIDLFNADSVTGRKALSRDIEGTTGERLVRANIIWGNDTIDTDRAILEAFDLPLDEHAPLPGAHPSPAPPAEKSRESDAPKPVLPLLENVNAWSQDPSRLLNSTVDRLRAWLSRAVLDRLNLDQDLINQDQGVGRQVVDAVFAPYSFIFPGADFGRRPGPDRLVFEVTPAEHEACLIGLLWYQHEGRWRVTPERPSGYRWPAGYTAAQLKAALDGYLDECATAVRNEVLRRLASPSVRDQVVGLRAVAQRCVGAEAGSATTSDPAFAGWDTVERAAHAALTEVNVDEWLGALYSVRQGESGAPQMVDTVGRDRAVEAALAQPWLFLTELSDNESAPPQLRSAAKALATSISASARAQIEHVRTAVSDIGAILDNADVQDVVTAAQELGERARREALFRPSDGYFAFTRACDSASQHRPSWAIGRSEPLPTSETDEPTAAIGVQRWARGVVVLARDLGTIQETAEQTRRHAERELAGGDDAPTLGDEVKELAAKALIAVEAISGGATNANAP